MSNFDTLRKINVNEKTEKKNGLTYLSWAWAWDEFCKIYPDATYKVFKNEQGLPYVYDSQTGYMCYVEVTADGKTHEMWLPVMDSANNAMKSDSYIKKTKYKEVNVDAATMFDINKTIMRCLVKCLAMFGLGLYIYAGEDLPEGEELKEEEELRHKPITKSQVKSIVALAKKKGSDLSDICDYFKVNTIDEMTAEEYGKCLNMLNAKGDK